VPSRPELADNSNTITSSPLFAGSVEGESPASAAAKALAHLVAEPPSRALPEVRRQIRLGSWKEIATYLGQGVRTVQRWEVQLKLPVHRVRGGGRGPVFAFTIEIDAWLRERAGNTGPVTATARANRSSANGSRLEPHYPDPHPALQAARSAVAKVENLSLRLRLLTDTQRQQVIQLSERVTSLAKRRQSRSVA